MRHRTKWLVAVIGILIAPAAVAQVVYGGPPYFGPRYFAPGLPPPTVMRIVRRAGFAPLSVPIRRGPNYVVAASDRAGGQVRILVNAYVGDIVAVRRVVAMRPLSPPVAAPPPYSARAAAPDPSPPPSMPSATPAPAYGRDEPPVSSRPSRGGYGTLPLPSRGFNDPPPLANVAPVGPVAPAPTPLPRPRPKLATNDDLTGTTSAPASRPAPPVSRAAAPALGGSPDETPAPLAKTANAPVAKEANKPGVPLVPAAPLE